MGRNKYDFVNQSIALIQMLKYIEVTKELLHNLEARTFRSKYSPINSNAVLLHKVTKMETNVPEIQARGTNFVS